MSSSISRPVSAARQPLPAAPVAMAVPVTPMGVPAASGMAIPATAVAFPQASPVAPYAAASAQTTTLPFAVAGHPITGVAQALPLPVAAAAPVVAVGFPMAEPLAQAGSPSAMMSSHSIPAVTGVVVPSPSVLPPQAASQARVQLPGKRKSLLVGINYFGTEAELSGCIADVKRMRPFLEQFGFPSDEGCQMVLLDEPGWPRYRRPTLSNMRQAIKWLVHDVQTGHPEQRNRQELSVALRYPESSSFVKHI